MVAGCGNKCVKYAFFLFNFLFFLLGGAMLGLSLWLRFDNNFQTKMSTLIGEASGTPIQLNQMYIALYIVAGLGGLLFLLGFLGCCGACCESVCALALFFIIVLILFVAQLAGGIYVYVKRNTIKDEIIDWYKRTVVDKYQEDQAIANQLDQVQRDLACCGATGCLDYSPTAPPSCKCAQFPDRPGCAAKAFEEIQKNIVYVVIVAIAILVVELLAMIFACVLCTAIRNSAYDYY